MQPFLTQPFTIESARSLMRPRPIDGHKGTFGTALLVCGSWQVGGCAVLAARACLRSGVGKVVVHVPEGLRQVLMTAVPEVVVSVNVADQPRTFTTPTVGRFQSVAVGPGIGLEPATKDGLIALLQMYKDLPHIIDADALTLLSGIEDWHKLLPTSSILTPHLGELSRLAGRPLKEADRLEAAKALSQSAKCVIIAKGHPTYTVLPNGITYENTTGSDAIATAGSGDVLTGIIAALLAQGYAIEAAAPLSVFLHGLAGDFAAQRLGHHSVTATDIINYLPQAFLALYKS